MLGKQYSHTICWIFAKEKYLLNILTNDHVSSLVSLNQFTSKVYMFHGITEAFKFCC